MHANPDAIRDARLDQDRRRRALRGKMIALGVDVEDLAAKMGVNRTTVYRKMADIGRMTIDDMLLIKDALSLTERETADIFLR